MPPFVLKFLGNMFFKWLNKRINLRKIERYVNEPNELDVQMKQMYKVVSRMRKEKEEIEKDLAILKGDSHPPQFSKKAYKEVIKRLKYLEKKEKRA